jgi:hypothetical protein
MTTEPLTTTTPTDVAASERGLLIAMLVMVVLGVAAMFLIS